MKTYITKLASLLCLLCLTGARAQSNASAEAAVQPAMDVKAKPARLYDAAHPAPDAKVDCIIYMIGDSTMSNKPLFPGYPERGWGQMLPQYFKSDVRIENHAMNGRSTKSFIDEGRWAVVREKLKAGDWVIIQFGHNDSKTNDVNRYTQPLGSFKTNLALFVTEARARGANPILCTPTVRRKFDDQGHVVDTHGDYLTGTRQVAAELKVPLLDINKRSDAFLTQLGEDRSKMAYDWFTKTDYPDLKKDLSDDTHFNAYGASRICDFAAEEMQTAVPELARHLNTGK